MLSNLTKTELDDLKSSSFNKDFFNGLRKYGNVYSVTSILSILGGLEFVSKENLQNACDNGTRIHSDIEKTYTEGKFILGNSLNRLGWMKFYTSKGKKWKPIHLEIKMQDDICGGTADAIFEINGETVMVDWKTTASSISNEMLIKYKMQIAKYSEMYSKLHKQIDRAYIVAFNKNGGYEIIEVENIDHWLEKFNKTYKIFKDYETKNKH